MTLKTEFEREGNGRMGEDSICALLTIDQKQKEREMNTKRRQTRMRVTKKTFL